MPVLCCGADYFKKEKVLHCMKYFNTFLLLVKCLNHGLLTIEHPPNYFSHVLPYAVLVYVCVHACVFVQVCVIMCNCIYECEGSVSVFICMFAYAILWIWKFYFGNALCFIEGANIVMYLKITHEKPSNCSRVTCRHENTCTFVQFAPR